jgi:nucleoside-diphosphate-sugar epimerase
VVNFVTGGSGFIGQRLVAALKCSGGELRVLSRAEHPNYKTIVCDLQSEDIPAQALDNVNTVFHLAGFAHDMRDASKIADLYYKVNVSAAIQLANLAVKSGVKRFVFVSSVKAGGDTPFGACANEKDQRNAEDVYGKTKREAELKLLEIGQVSGMHVSIIRPSLVYGPDVKGNLQLMLSGIEKGWFPPLPEMGNRRSMIHVDDLVRAILLVADDDRANGGVFIATDGTPYSSREIYNTMCGMTGKSTPKWSVPKILFDMVSLLSPRIKYKVDKLLGDECYSSAKLEALGFKAQKTLKDMNETSF